VAEGYQPAARLLPRATARVHFTPDPDDHSPARRPGPGRGCRDGRCSPHPARHRELRARTRRGLRVPGQGNQPGLFDALDALPWRDVPVAHATAGRGHGRIETRTSQVLDAPGDLPFPHVSQAYLIELHVTALDGTPVSDVAALGVTSLHATRASPETIAALVRGQWAIESLHWLRSPGVPRAVA
jgi:hypothetical protein